MNKKLPLKSDKPQYISTGSPTFCFSWYHGRGFVKQFAQYIKRVCENQDKLQAISRLKDKKLRLHHYDKLAAKIKAGK